MGMFGVLDVSAAGMDVQQARLEVAASNLANARTTGKDGAAYKPLAVVVRSAIADGAGAAGSPVTLGQLPRPMVAEVVETNVAPKLVYDPGHPDADERGMVALPGVDPVTSMLDLVSISRGYEANLRAFDITRSLLQRTLELGEEPMSIEAIAAVGSQLATATPALMTTGFAPPPDLNAVGADSDLFDRLVNQLGEIDAGMQAGGHNATELALGQTDNLHQTMIAGERTRLQFDLMMSMRNRVLEAYQEIMRMQV